MAAQGAGGRKKGWPEAPAQLGGKKATADRTKSGGNAGGICASANKPPLSVQCVPDTPRDTAGLDGAEGDRARLTTTGNSE